MWYYYVIKEKMANHDSNRNIDDMYNNQTLTKESLSYMWSYIRCTNYFSAFLNQVWALFMKKLIQIQSSK